jgi:hypothetical protein
MICQLFRYGHWFILYDMMGLKMCGFCNKVEEQICQNDQMLAQELGSSPTTSVA